MTRKMEKPTRAIPEYKIWVAMKGRCLTPTNSRFKYYGGRGITVCARWQVSFEAFIKDVGPRPSSKYSIDRFPDNDGHYEPGNVRWALPEDQQRNTRRTRLLTIGEETLCLADWCLRYGAEPNRVAYRLGRGMSPMEALTLPLRSGWRASPISLMAPSSLSSVAPEAE